MPETGDKVLGASDGGASPLLVAGTRGGYRFVALGFDVRDSDLPLRTAWPLFVIDCINWFTDEDAQYLSSFRTGEVWRVPVAGGVTQATVKLPDGTTQPVPVHEGRAVLLGEQRRLLRARPRATRRPPSPPTCSTRPRAPSRRATPRRSTASPRASSQASTSASAREIWIYLLLAVALLTALEWATYHRRMTV